VSQLKVQAPQEVLDDPEVKRLLAEADELLESNPLQGYLPHDKQRPFHEYKGRVKVFLGGNRSGKTTGGICDDIIQAIDPDAVPEHLRAYKKWEAPFKCRIVTPDFTRTMIAVQEAIRRWCPKSQLQGGSWEKAYEKSQRILRFANGSFFEFMTYEQDIDKFGGSARHRIHYDEEPPGEKGELVRQECTMRLTDYNGDEVFTFTPLLGLTWTFDELWESKGPEVAPSVWQDDRLCVVRVDMDDNPHLSEEGKAAALATIPEEYRKARKEGNFVHFQGLVYPEWDSTIHVCDPIDPSHLAHQTFQISIDPGIHRTAVLFGSFDKDNHLLIFDELILEGFTPERTTMAIRSKEQFWKIRDAFYLIDPAARNRSLTDAERVESAFQKAGLPVVPAQNDVETGIFEVKRRLEKRLLTVTRNCQNLLWERERYRLAPTTDGKFSVVKRNDHGMDCLRYLAMSRPLIPPEVTRQRQRRWVPGTAPPSDFQPLEQTSPPMGEMS
jgi:phage terminase large subunit-like protein